MRRQTPSTRLLPGTSRSRFRERDSERLPGLRELVDAKRLEMVELPRANLSGCQIGMGFAAGFWCCEAGAQGHDSPNQGESAYKTCSNPSRVHVIPGHSHSYFPSIFLRSSCSLPRHVSPSPNPNS
jgi:hypothetical protein